MSKEVTNKRKCMATAVLALMTVVTVGATMMLPAEASAASKPSKPKQVKSLTIKATGTNSIKISFKKVAKAKGYKIYQATKKNGKYKKVKTIKQKKAKRITYTKKKLKTGKRYYYKVRAYKTYKKGKKTKYVYGKYSVKKSAKTKKPSPYAAVNLSQVQKEYKGSKTIDKSVGTSGEELYFYQINPPKEREGFSGKSGGASVGYIYKWAEECSGVNGIAKGKWYGANFSLNLKSSECTAYYTLDGSTPSPKNGTKVTKSSGRVKIKAQHTGEYYGGGDTLNLKIHFYVKGKLVALSYNYDNDETCLHKLY